MSTRIAAFGVQIKHGTSATPTAVLGGLVSVSPKFGDRTLIDVTAHDATTTKAFIDSGLRDTVEFDGEILYDPADAGHEALRAAQAAGTVYYVTLIFPDAGAAQWVAVGYVTKFDVPSLGTTDAIKANFTFKAKSADTFTQ